MTLSPILSAFVDISTQTPNLVAIVSEKKTITYGELISLANSLAYALQKQIKVSGQIVAIIGEREIETPLAMIACLLAGIPFVVIDKTYPENRIASICKIAHAVALLHCKSSLLIQSENFKELLEIKTFIKIDYAHPIKKELPIPYECDTAYVLFTSGTTGFPKGIRIGHAPLPHFIEWYKQIFYPAQGARFSMLSGLSHDPILRDIFVPLSIGGELHIPAQDQILAKDYLYLWMNKSKIQYAHMTPQLIGVLLSNEKKDSPLTELDYVFSGGDVLSTSIFSSLKECAINVKLVNFYGTSETPQAMAFQVIDHNLKAPYPLGKPINDVVIEILDEDLNLLDTSVIGEISIKTKYLSLGYINKSLNNPASSERDPFLQTLLSNQDGKRTYLTGDMGYKDQQGNLHFCGRKDDQVKIRGYRVNCVEIASTIERLGLAKHAVVIPESGHNEETYLIAFTTSDSEMVSKGMREALPPYMVPTQTILVTSIPLLPNGKVDRNALKIIAQNHKVNLRNNNNYLDNELLKNISKLFVNRNFNTKLSFVEMGGDSLSYINASLLIEKYNGFLTSNWENIPLNDLLIIKSKNKNIEKKRLTKLLFSNMQLSILLRAVSIILVVMIHAYIISGTPTSTLFVIAGMSISRFQLREVINNCTLKPIFIFIGKYAIPACLWQIMRSLFITKFFWFPDLILTGTFWQNPYGGHYTFWFLDVLTASILIFGILAIFSSYITAIAKKFFKTTEMYFDISLIILFLGVLAYIIQIKTNVWNGEVGHTSVGPFRWFWMIPFGAAIQQAHSNVQKMIVSIIGLIIVLIFMLVNSANLSSQYVFNFDYFFIISVLGLIWVKQIPIPKFLNKTILIIASNSLFIYIVNMPVFNILIPTLTNKWGFPDWNLLNVFAAISLGVLTGTFWNKFSLLAHQEFKSL